MVVVNLLNEIISDANDEFEDIPQKLIEEFGVKNAEVLVIKDDYKYRAALKVPMMDDESVILTPWGHNHATCVTDSQIIEEFDTAMKFPMNRWNFRMRSHKFAVICAVKKDGMSLQYANYRLRNDLDVILHAMRNNPEALFAVTDRSNQALILHFVKDHPDILKYASSDLTMNMAFMLKAVFINGQAFTYASKDLRDSVELKAVRFHYHEHDPSLRGKYDDYKNKFKEREEVENLMAIVVNRNKLIEDKQKLEKYKWNPKTYEDRSEHLKLYRSKDKLDKIVGLNKEISDKSLFALRVNLLTERETLKGAALDKINDELEELKDFHKYILNKRLKNIDDELHEIDNTPFSLKNLHQYHHKFEKQRTIYDNMNPLDIQRVLKKTPLSEMKYFFHDVFSVVKQSVTLDGSTLQWASPRLQNHPIIVRTAIITCPDAYKWASEELRQDEQIALKAMEADGSNLQWYLGNSMEVIIAALKKTKSALQYASLIYDQIRDTYEDIPTQLEFKRRWSKIVTESLKSDGLLLRFVREQSKSLVNTAVSNNGMALCMVDGELKNEDVCLLAVKQNQYALKFVPITYLKNKGFMKIVAKLSVVTLRYAPAPLNEDESICQIAFGSNGNALEFAPNKIKTKKKLVLIAVRKNPLSLAFADPSIQDDREVVETAVKIDGMALQYASDTMKHNAVPDEWITDWKKLKTDIANGLKTKNLKVFKKNGVNKVDINGFHVDVDPKRPVPMVQLAVSNNGLALQFVDEDGRDDFDLVSMAVRQNGDALQFASDRLRDDAVLVNKATDQSDMALMWASGRVRSDFNTVYKVVKREPHALRFVHEQLRDSDKFKTLLISAIETDQSIFEKLQDTYKDSDIVKSAVLKEGSLLQYAPKDLRNSEDVVLHAVANRGKALRFASAAMRGNEAIVMQAIENDADALQYASDVLKSNYKVVSAAVAKSGKALRFASASMRNNEEIVMSAIQQYADALYYASDRLQKRKEFKKAAKKSLENNDEELQTVKKLKTDPEALKTMSDKIKDTKSMVEIAIQTNPHALQWASDRLKNDRELIRIALRKDGTVIKLLSTRLQDNPHVRADADIDELAEEHNKYLKKHIKTNTSASALKNEHVGEQLKNEMLNLFPEFNRLYRNTE